MATKKPVKSKSRPTFDFSKAKPNPYAKRYAKGTNVVLLDRDVAKRFKNSEAVNKALRGLLEAAKAIDKPVDKKKTA